MRAGGRHLPASLQPYLPLHNSTVHGVLTFEWIQADANANPTIGSYETGQWTLDLPALGTTWTSLFGSIEVGSVEAPRLGAFPCFGCLAAFGYFSQNSNPAARRCRPAARASCCRSSSGRSDRNSSPMRSPATLRRLGRGGGFFVGATQIRALPFEVRAVPEPAVMMMAAPALAWLLARRARGERRRRRATPIS